MQSWNVASLSGSTPDGYTVTKQVTTCQKCSPQEAQCTAAGANSSVSTCTNVTPG